MSRTRIEARFRKLKAEGRAAFVTFITAGDPDTETCEALLAGLPAAGADIIELGMPFSDPMADGPAIQASGLRALRAGASMEKTLGLVTRFRARDADTPIILMGYYNPIYAFGVERFLARALEAGVDGLIVVDLPPEEDAELCLPARDAGIAFIRLATPTTDEKRLPRVLANATGFLYYVSVTGITGAALSPVETLSAEVEAIRARTDLPVVVGFGIKSPGDAAGIARIADGAVVGSAIVSRIAEGLDAAGRPRPGLVPEVLGFVRQLSGAVATARETARKEVGS